MDRGGFCSFFFCAELFLKRSHKKISDDANR